MAPIGSRRSGEHALNSTIEIRAAAALTSYIFTLEPDSCVSSDGTDLSRKTVSRGTLLCYRVSQ
ncbi:MAG: hypothetical protein DME35_09825 [Verrucomicrobia bacterium]|nr:MAG: hypothetical protein DME35_09825 [Verrucomicrobiota bacterium]PYL30976.1 MAG: hypothetical protein DMF45_00635 [Verrucomicrobiota bacterium]